jgi:hypothetical protein
VRRTRALVVLVGLASAVGALHCSPGLEENVDAAAGAVDASVDASTDASEEFGCLVCGDVTEELPDWVAVQAEVVRVCSNTDSCHGSGAGEMGLSPQHWFESMIDVPSYEVPSLERVLPGDPENSYVYRKLACEGGIILDCMPNEAVHDPALARLFHRWIEAGAPTE